MRIGVFGGSFDPVHLGHLILAEQCREQGRLDQVWFIPAARPPHKQEINLTPFPQRVEMLQLAIAGQPAFSVNELERDRPGPSYTAVTLQELHERNGGHQWFLLIGADALVDLPGWHQPQQIVERAQLLVVGRADTPLPGIDELKSRLGPATRMQQIIAPLIDISSSNIRQRVREGRSFRYMVPRAVEAYIEDKQLYRGS